MRYSVLHCLLSLVVILCAVRADAQVAIGMKGGLNLNRLKAEVFLTTGSANGTTTPPDVDASGTGFHAGLFMSTSRGPGVGLLIEALYSLRSSDYSYDYSLKNAGITNAYKGSTEYRLHYIELPVLLNVRPKEKLTFQFGAAAAFLQSAYTRDQGTRTVSSPGSFLSLEYDDKSSSDKDLSKVSIDVVVGADYEVISGLHGSVRFLADLNDLDKGKDIVAKSSLFQFSIGYTLIGRTTD